MGQVLLLNNINFSFCKKSQRKRAKNLVVHDEWIFPRSIPHNRPHSLIEHQTTCIKKKEREMTTTKGSRDWETLHTIGHGRGPYVNLKRGYGARVWVKWHLLSLSLIRSSLVFWVGIELSLMNSWFGREFAPTFDSFIMFWVVLKWVAKTPNFYWNEGEALAKRRTFANLHGYL